MGSRPKRDSTQFTPPVMIAVDLGLAHRGACSAVRGCDMDGTESTESTVAQEMPTAPGPVPDKPPCPRPDLEPYLVAIKEHVMWSGLWTMLGGNTLRSLRERYDAGDIELCQGRTADMIYQYAIPRKAPTKPRLFFRTPVIPLHRPGVSDPQPQNVTRGHHLDQDLVSSR